MFAPEKSIVKMKFRSELPVWLNVSPPVASEWDPCLQILEGHSCGVYSLAFSHDSKLLASASWDQTIKIWDVATGICISTLKVQHSRGYVDAFSPEVAFSPNSKVLVSSLYNEIHLWDAVTGTCTSIFKHSDDIILGGVSTAFSHDSRILASGSRKCIKLWDVTSGMSISTLSLDGDVSCLVAFSHDSSMLVSFSYDSTIKLWNTATGACKSTIKVNNEAFQLAAFSQDSRILALVSRPRIRLWNTVNGKCIAILEGQREKVFSLCFSHDSSMLASACSKGDDTTWHIASDIKIWDVATSRNIATFKGHSKKIFSLQFSHDSKLLASASYDSTIQIWDRDIDVDQVPLSAMDKYSITEIQLMKGTKTLISRSLGKETQLWDVPTASCTATLPECWDLIAVADNTELLATTSTSNSHIQFWDIGTDANITTVKGFNSSISRTDPNFDFEIMIAQIDGHHLDNYFAITAITFSQNSQLLASASAADGIIKVWDVSSSACIATLTGHCKWVKQLAILPHSDVLVSSSSDGTVRIWDIRTGTCTAMFEGQSGPDNKSIAFSRDYSLLASGLKDGSIDVWDLSTGKCQIKLLGAGQGPVHTVAFSHSSALLVSVAPRPRNQDHEYIPYRFLKFWDIPTGLCLATIDVSYLATESMSFYEVGSCVITSVGEFTLKGTCHAGLIYRRC